MESHILSILMMETHLRLMLEAEAVIIVKSLTFTPQAVIQLPLFGNTIPLVEELQQLQSQKVEVIRSILHIIERLLLRHQKYQPPITIKYNINIATLLLVLKMVLKIPLQAI